MSVRAQSEYEKVYVYDVDGRGLGAWMVTTSGDAFHTDPRTLKTRKHSVMTKLGVRKIVELWAWRGAAITDSTGMLVVWGDPIYLPDLIEEPDVVKLQSYQPNTKCTLCTIKHDYTEMVVGQTALNYCQVTETHPSYTPTGGPQNKKYVKHGNRMGYKCSVCDKSCTSKVVNSIPLCYCQPCDLLLDLNCSTRLLEVEDKYADHKMVRMNEKVVDVAISLEGYWILMDSNVLVHKGQASTNIQMLVLNPDNVEMKAVHCCHSRPFVTTVDGGLYKCTKTVKKPFPIIYTLEKVVLPAAVVKVRCGWDVVACLLSNSTVYTLIDDYPPVRFVYKDGTDTFVDLAAAHWRDKFFIQVNKGAIFKIFRPLSILGFDFRVGASDCNKKLVKKIFKKTFPGPLRDITGCLPGPAPPSLAQCLSGPSGLLSSDHHPTTSSVRPPFLSGLCGKK